MKPFHFHPEALVEADGAAKFYEDRQKGLGKRFVEALTDTINRIKRDPELYKKIDGNIRKCRLLHFSKSLTFSKNNLIRHYI